MKIQEIKGLLDDLRKGNNNYELEIQSIRDYVHENKLWLNDIGTSEEELKKLLVNGYKASAQKCLSEMRRGTGAHIFTKERMHEWLNKGKLSIEDIGTSKEELESLRILCSKAFAQNMLVRLREGSDDYDNLSKEIIALACDGDFSLSDIGTSIKEIEELKVKSFIVIAKDKLYFLRQGKYDDMGLNYILEGLDERRFYTEDIGSTFAEIRELQARHKKKWRYRLLKKILGL